MITSPSRNGLVTTFVDLHKADVPVKVVNVSTAPTAVNQGSMKALPTEEICDGRRRSVTVHWRSVKHSIVNRTEYPQTTTFTAMRAMRAVFDGFCDRRRRPIYSRVLRLTIEMPLK